MIDIIKVIVDKVVDSIDPKAILKAKNDKKYNGIGRDIFQIYMTLNEIYVEGISIVNSAKNDINWCLRKIKEGHEDAERSTDLPEKLRRQHDRLLKFLDAYRHLNEHVAVLSPEVHRSIEIFIHPKMGIIDQLQRLLRHRVDARILLMQPVQGKLVYELQGDKSDANMLEIIPDLGLIPAGKVKILQIWIEKTDPEKRLEEIRIQLDKLHALIIENFTVRELLLKVGDKRLREADLPHWDLSRGSL